MLNHERSAFWLVLGAGFVTVSRGLCILVLLSYAKHWRAGACKQKDVVSASEVYELSSGCNSGVGGTVMGTGHEVHALESPELSHLFVRSQPHPGTFCSNTYFSMSVLGVSEWVMSVKPCAPEGDRKQHQEHHSSCAGQGALPCWLLQGQDFMLRKATAAQHRLQHPSCQHLL